MTALQIPVPGSVSSVEREYRRPTVRGVLRVRCAAGVTPEWIETAIAGVPLGPGRRHGESVLPSAERVFVKIYNPRSGHSLWRRVRASRAIDEGRGYRAFAAAGIPTPELIAWGEVRRLGLWQQGIVITRFVEGPTLAEHLRTGGLPDSFFLAADMLARIHRAALAHGDPRLRNFLISGDSVVPFDLCSWGRLNESRRRGDLVKFLGSALTILDRAIAERALARYSAAARWRCADPGALLRDGEAYAREEGVP